MTRIAIIGSGPTGLYTLKGLTESAVPLSVTMFEANADPGKGTPYHPRANDRAMLANIASIELPPLIESLESWLRRKSPVELALLGVSSEAIGEREFYPRVVLGDYFEAQLQALLLQATARGHSIDIKGSHRVVDVELRESDIRLEVRALDETTKQQVFDHVVMATGHDWPETTETKPGYFISPWPAANLDTIGDVPVGVLGTSLSGIDAVVCVAASHGTFLLDESGSLHYHSTSEDRFHITMMSRKGLLPEADFYCPIPYEPLTIFTPSAVDALVEQAPDRLLDTVFDLFRAELLFSDADYAERIGLGLLSVETIADAYFADRIHHDPFTWAALNLAEAKANKASRTTVAWRYAILQMHEVVLRVVPHLNAVDLKRFHKHFKSLFVDDYATVPHQSIERLLALHRAGRLSVLRLGSDYALESDVVERGVRVTTGGVVHEFEAFIDATGQQAVAAADLPFPSLVGQGVVREARTLDASSIILIGDTAPQVSTGGIDLDNLFRPRFEKALSRNIYASRSPSCCTSCPSCRALPAPMTSAARWPLPLSQTLAAVRWGWIWGGRSRGKSDFLAESPSSGCRHLLPDGEKVIEPQPLRIFSSPHGVCQSAAVAEGQVYFIKKGTG